MNTYKLTDEQFSELQMMKQADPKLFARIEKKFNKEAKSYPAYGYYSIGGMVSSDLYNMAMVWKYKMMKLNLAVTE